MFLRAEIWNAFPYNKLTLFDSDIYDKFNSVFVVVNNQLVHYTVEVLFGLSCKQVWRETDIPYKPPVWYYFHMCN